MKNKLFIFFSLILTSCSKEITTLSLSPVDIFNNCKSSIVELKTYNDENNICYGSAVLIDSNGTFASNAHLLRYKEGGIYKEFENIEIRFSFEENYREVSIIKYDSDLDISFLKLNNTDNLNLKPISIEKELDLKHGQKVYAIGNGMNHGIGITEGIISIPTVNITYEDITRKVIQCDLVINDGNSGGALLNERSSLIGLTTFRLKDDNAKIIYGIAYCIPIDTVITYLNN